MRKTSSWIACQLGAREHYSIPRALNMAGLLEYLVTDIWVDQTSFWAQIPLRQWRERFHADLPKEQIRSWNLKSLAVESSMRLMRLPPMDVMMTRNKFFQRDLVNQIKEIHSKAPDRKRTIFCYSYTAKEVFRVAREFGWRTVLGQMDPGFRGLNISEQLELNGYRQPNVPDYYWPNWRQERELADRIIVNSEWSRQSLIQDGEDPQKLLVLPLAFEPGHPIPASAKEYPNRFDQRRPLRLLFLGQVNLMKGMGVLMETMRQLSEAPVELTVVGSISIPIPEDLRTSPKIFWKGRVPRSETDSFFQNADLFLFPTFSDGFGLTQLEAQSWRLPIISSGRCADVVRHNWNGLRLPELTPGALAQSILYCLENPAQLHEWSENSTLGHAYSLDALSQSLSEMDLCLQS